LVSGGCVFTKGSGLCNISLTTDDGIILALKFGDHNYKGNTDLINAEKTKCVMKNTAKSKEDSIKRTTACP